MKELNTYIIEKLHLNKDTLGESESVYEKICNSTGLSRSKYNFEAERVIKNWIENNNIKDVNFFVKGNLLEKIPKAYQQYYNNNPKYYNWLSSILFNDLGNILYDNCKKDRLMIIGNKYYLDIVDYKRGFKSGIFIIDADYDIEKERN